MMLRSLRPWNLVFVLLGEAATLVYGQTPPNFRLRPSSQSQHWVELAQHPGNPHIMLATSFVLRFDMVHISESFSATANGGLTWFGRDTIPIYPIGPPLFTKPAIDGNGRFMVCGNISVVAGLATSYSTDLGSTWSALSEIPGATNPDRPRIIADGVPSSPHVGRWYVVWANFSAPLVSRVLMSHSTDGGATWTQPSVVSPVASSGHHHQGANACIGPEGEVYVVWANDTTNGGNSTEDSLGFACSTDGGVSWARATNRADDMNGIRTGSFFHNTLRAEGYPRIAVDGTRGPRRGWIYVVAAEKNFPPYAMDVSDIVLHRSTDGGVAWTRGRVNQDTPGNGKYQYIPAITVDAAGGVSVVYYDSRNVATNDSVEVFLSRSVDGGNTWTDILVSEHRFTPRAIGTLGTGWPGDNVGVASTDSTLLVVWCSTASGMKQVWGAFLPLVQTEVRFLDERTPMTVSLDQNYPNPFNPETNISFDLP
ncbi:MAG: sialidase family protein, partial [Bacteroidota bacterium]